MNFVVIGGIVVNASQITHVDETKPRKGTATTTRIHLMNGEFVTTDLSLSDVANVLGATSAENPTPV